MNFFDDFDSKDSKPADNTSEIENSASPEEAAADSTVEQTETAEPEAPKALNRLDSHDDEIKFEDFEASSDFWAGIAEVKPIKKKVNISFIILMILILLICTSIITVAIKGKGWLVNLINGDQRIEFTLPVAETPELDDEYYQDDGRYTTEGLAQAVSPSVVQIQIYNSEKSTLTPSGQGSGIIMSEDGYILTNAHVVSDADKGIKVILDDETEYSAKLVGMDEASDIAVIKIPAKDLTPAQFGDSDEVNVGEDVVAIGSPAGFYGSVTKGIVSGLDRQIKVQNSNVAMSCIQIDAAINPGNSGGALFNMWGQVIGITSSKLASSEYDGIGFAISMNAAKPIIENLMEYGYVQNRVRVGITFYAISETTAEMYETVAGLCVVDIDSECDIANTELQAGDIITSIDGTAYTDSDELQSYLSTKSPGDTLTAKVYRKSDDGTESEFEISFKLMEDDGSLIEADESSES